jgi:hypothetical protein
MREPAVGDRVVDLAAHCDGLAQAEGIVVSVQTWTGCARVEDDAGARRFVPLHELRTLDGCGNEGLTCPLDGYPRYT